jgi:hypothetical protein
MFVDLQAPDEGASELADVLANALRREAIAR